MLSFGIPLLISSGLSVKKHLPSRKGREVISRGPTLIGYDYESQPAHSPVRPDRGPTSRRICRVTIPAWSSHDDTTTPQAPGLYLLALTGETRQSLLPRSRSVAGALPASAAAAPVSVCAQGCGSTGAPYQDSTVPSSLGRRIRPTPPRHRFHRAFPLSPAPSCASSACAGHSRQDVCIYA